MARRAVFHDTVTDEYDDGGGSPLTIGGGASAADDVSNTPAGSIAATDVQAAINELDSEKAPVSHAHSGADITSGTVADARIDAAIARDSEVTSAISALSSVYQAKDASLDYFAGLDPATNVKTILEAANYAAVNAALGEYVGGGGDIAVNDTNYVTIASATITIAAGQKVIVEADYLILNNSGGTRTYTHTLDVGGFVTECVDSQTITASSTQRVPYTFRGSAEVRTTSLCYALARTFLAPQNSAGTAGAGSARAVWNTDTSDRTGTVTVALKVKSNSATATQTLTLLGYRIRVI